MKSQIAWKHKVQRREMDDTMLMKCLQMDGVLHGSLPWAYETKRESFSLPQIDSRSDILRCFNCQKQDCDNCIRRERRSTGIAADKKERIRKQFLSMYNEGKSVADICTAMKIARSTYYKYKVKYAHGIL